MKKDTDNNQIFPEKVSGPVKWHKEACIKDAKRFNRKGEWNKLSAGSYNSARINGWMDECTTHMKKYKTIEECQKNALNYKSKEEWFKKDPSYYWSAYSRGWFAACTGHMPKNVNAVEDKNDWKVKIRTESLKEAEKYNSLEEIAELNPKLLRRLSRYGLKNDFKRKKGLPACLKKALWNFEKCTEEFNKFPSRKEWMEKSPDSYKAASKGGWLRKISPDIFCILFTKEECLSDCIKYSSLKDWRQNSKAIYNYSKNNGLFNDCLNQMGIVLVVNNWTF
jgi:hypothetical protein